MRPADGTRLVRLVRSVAPDCPVLLISGSAPRSQLGLELVSLPTYRLRGDPAHFNRLLQEVTEILSIKKTVVGPPPAFSLYVAKAMSCISTHCAEALKVNTVGEAIGVSRGLLAHLFRSELCMTVKECVTGEGMCDEGPN